MCKIDLNADIGESFGVYKIGQDNEILKYITSANIACGFHAGDPKVMRNTVKEAMLNGVSIGAHPGLNDLIGFGRRNISITPDEAYEIVVYQIGALYGFVKAEGGIMQHVKPHGALYNMAVKDNLLANAIAHAIYDVDPELILFGLSGSELINQGNLVGLKTASEVFADRTYQTDGSLTPRSQKDSMVTDQKEAIDRVIRMIKDKKVICQQGTDIDIIADTVCIHGDNIKALEFASEIKNGLTSSGIKISSFKDCSI